MRHGQNVESLVEGASNEERLRVLVTVQAELERSERRLEIATNAAQIGIWEWDLQTNEMVYSERAKAICGFPAHAPVSFQQVTDVTYPEDYPRTSAMAKRATDPAIRAREVYRYRIRRADNGEVRWLLAHGEATFGEVAGRTVALSYIGTLMDITDETNAELALVRSESRLRLAVEAGQMAVWEADLSTGALSPSPELNRLFGFPAEAQPTIDDLRGRYAPGERERLEMEGEAIRAKGGTQIQTEMHIVLPDSGDRWLLLRATALTERTHVIGVVMDITERKLAEERTMLVAGELQHRIKNTLTVVQSIAAQSFRGVADPDAVNGFMGRLAALSAASDMMTADDWSNADLRAIVERVTLPFRSQREAFVVSGPDLRVPTRQAVAIAMALHELSTNAAKYGALTSPDGRVLLSWRLDGNAVELSWREEGGPAVIPPQRKGFGTRLLERGLFAGSEGTVELSFSPTGVLCIIRIAT